MLNSTMESEKKLGIKIPVILVGIEYKLHWKPRSKVYVRVGKPLEVDTPNLEEIV